MWQENEHAAGELTVAAKACQFTAGSFEFAQAADDDGTVPVRIVARSGKPIDHWYWGRVVHDLAGMTAKPKVPIDWCHDYDEVLGYLDEFKTDKGQLETAGAVVPYAEGDKVNEIVHKARLGVPYEASIFFGGTGLKIEEVRTGAKAKVNGYEIEGPAVIFREWPLRGVAICPYGIDQNTKSELSADDEVISVTVLSSGEDTMDPAKNDEAQSGLVHKLAAGFAALIGLAEKPETEAADSDQEPEQSALASDLSDAANPPAAKDPKAEVKAELKRFRDAFGPAGVDRFLEGKTFQEAQALHSAQAAAEREAQAKKLEAEKQDLKKRLAAVDRGEDEPADFQADATDDPQAKVIKQFTPVLGDNLARLAAGMKRK